MVTVSNKSDVFISGKGFTTHSKGVRKDNKVNSTQVIYISTKKSVGVGVRRDCIIHMVLPPMRQKMLLFSTPCLCGSLTHSSPRSTQCVLCPRYMDP